MQQHQHGGNKKKDGYRICTSAEAEPQRLSILFVKRKVN
jgi:hypothetical protein